MNYELTIKDNIRLLLFGVTPSRKIKKEGWLKPIQHYIFICDKHGLVEDYPHGFEQKLYCPKCRKEKMKEIEYNT